MSTKTPVSALEEYCSKYKKERPEYEYIAGEDCSFICQLKFGNMEASGTASSKRKAKHLAAINMMCKLRLDNSNPIGIGAKYTNVLPEYDHMKTFNGGLASAAKTPVSALEEFCAKFKKGSPEYKCMSNGDNGFVCSIKLLDMEAHGIAPSKREAKHIAAVNIMNKLKKLPGLEFNGLINPKPNLPESSPLPTLELKSQQNDPKTSPQLLDIPQKTFNQEVNADDIIPILELDMELISTSRILDDVKSEQQSVFNIYREVKDSNAPIDCQKVLLRDRHNYFKSFPYSLKAAAFKILETSNDGIYFSEKERALSVLKALKLTPKITKVPGTSLQQLIQIELICDYDCIFLGFECDIYGTVLQYFREMLI
ncbi:interferon-inducible double-stranded RNA-dependent protein kinase activator A homolog [Drosophila tropicalis]|uniref:interferon-inducible double-stranded RNA-dependent protein kinase activator A homolog n=1 Tax=Drosophila tropicalis TaxID=46794 RepID=UPI0035AB94AC